MTLKDYLIKLTVECEQLMAMEKAELVSHFNKYEETGFLKFSKNETSKMASAFRKQFSWDKNIAHVAKNFDGVYTITYKRYGHDIKVTDTDLIKAKNRFIEATYA